ncbi:PREDICTED: uncharacterized protein LOC109233686 [Nicotiana attenuata]|uniref:uncharacterized protein LOC109233686 n=1 Tax=Nicotiana attenuata TaxID=49451 RepID=UPI0009050E45|nr:PREDICTED: uncharacterized protein LOC109233686 [Nicotiana attenuata]
MAPIPLACKSGTEQTIQLQINVLLKTSIQTLHDRATHNVAPAAIDKTGNEDEKIGGIPVNPPEYEDIAFCVNSKGLLDLGYKGGPFTWWNERPNVECIFKSLDRILVNLPFQNLFPTIEIEYLIRIGFDHAHLFMSCREQAENDHKLKNLKAVLSKWSKVTSGDIFKQLAILEGNVKVKEMLFEVEPTRANRIVLHQAQAELKKYLSIEDQYWKQKARMTLFAEGGRNTRFFHNHLNGKGKKLQLKRI